MTAILTEILETELSQDVNVTTETWKNVAAIYPYLTLYNSPAGTFTFSVIKNAVTLFSKTFTSQDIKDSIPTSDNYAHVFYPIIPTDLLPLGAGLHTFKISASGYSWSESSYLGWNKQFEDIQNEMDYTPAGQHQYSLAYRIKVYK